MTAGPHGYSVYGVAIASDWPLAFPRRDDGAGSLAEVHFVDATDEDFAGVDVPPGANEPWFHAQVLSDQSVYLRWSQLYEFRIGADGSRVACRPLKATDRSVLQNFLFGQALSFALVHQGLEPLHAAVVRIDDEAIGFLGDCTFGKSTLVASFVHAGYRLVTDDLLMVAAQDGRLAACPGAGRIKLHPDSAGAFIEDPTRSEPLNALTPKRSFPLPSHQLQATAVPLTTLFVLPVPEARDRMASIEIRPLPRAALFHELLKNTFNADILTRARLQRQFASAARLAQGVDGFRLQYPDGLHHLPLVRQRIIDYVRRRDIVTRRQIQ